MFLPNAAPGTAVFNRPIGNWDTSKVTNMSSMFSECPQFNQDLGNWNTGNVTNMTGMFYNCSTFDCDLSKWDVSKTTNMYLMFSSCTAYNNGANTNVNPITGRSGLNGWNVSSVVGGPLSGNVTTGFASMFNNCTAFNRSLADWSVGACKMFRYMFSGCTALKQAFGTWNMGNALNADGMFITADINDPATSTNYDNTLIGWAAQTLKPSVFFGGGNSKYGLAGAAARTTLTSPPKSWSITDGGPI
jgi:surface protein